MKLKDTQTLAVPTLTLYVEESCYAKVLKSWSIIQNTVNRFSLFRISSHCLLCWVSFFCTSISVTLMVSGVSIFWPQSFSNILDNFLELLQLFLNFPWKQADILYNICIWSLIYVLFMSSAHIMWMNASIPQWLQDQHFLWSVAGGNFSSDL
jgi:hypothetical protein